MEYLSRRRIPFSEKNVRTDAQALQELIQMGLNATPVIVVDGEAIVGFDQARLDAALARAGAAP
ncbi:MAG: glutaredoxin family protein [Armatimonadetes bacterium]|nr:glutaredoxin family protein [Armatimonadota bacterium]